MDFGLQKILSNLDLINNSIKNTVYNNRLIEKAIISAKYIVETGKSSGKFCCYV